MGIAGVLVIGAAQFGQGDFSDDSGWGMAAILISAVLYALNLVLQRKQAQLAGPIEIAMVQNLFMALILSLAAPWLLVWPQASALYDIALAAALATVALLPLVMELCPRRSASLGADRIYRVRVGRFVGLAAVRRSRWACPLCWVRS